MTIIKRRMRNPRLGEAVFIGTGRRLEAGRVVRNDASQSRAPVFPTELLLSGELAAASRSANAPERTTTYTMERFHVYLIDQDAMMVCGREDFALLPELRHLIPRMSRAPQAV